jgi:hypothetical protein
MRYPLQSALGAALAILTLTGPAAAYVGPAAGVSLIGSVLGLLAVLGTAIWFVVMAPIRAARRRSKAKSEEAAVETGN